MWFSSNHRGDRIFVRGDFAAPGFWLIQATVARGSELETTVGSVPVRRIVRELWHGIVLEGRVGRRLGADVIHVVVDGDEDIARLFAASESSEAPSPPGSSGASTPAVPVSTI